MDTDQTVFVEAGSTNSKTTIRDDEDHKHDQLSLVTESFCQQKKVAAISRSIQVVTEEAVLLLRVKQQKNAGGKGLIVEITFFVERAVQGLMFYF